jgi:S1-C subfamily serine protease
MTKQKSVAGVMIVAVSLAFTPIPVHAETFTGTAFAISEEGNLVTNEHVISGCSGHQYGESLTVRQGNIRTAGAVRVSDKSLDLAVVRFSPTAFGSASRLRGIAALRESPPLRAGEQAISQKSLRMISAAAS